MSAADQAAVASPPSPISVLPMALLARVLQHVPQQQRLACCALVSRDRAAATAAGTLSINCRCTDGGESVCAWIQKHGRQLESMHLQGEWNASKPQLQLPFGELQQLTALHLQNVHVRPHAADNSTLNNSSSSSGSGGGATSSSTPSQHMPKLQGLWLHDCVFDSAPALLQLGPFTAVTQLSLRSLAFVVPRDSGSPAAAPQASEAQQRLATSAAVVGVLQHMPQLQCLYLTQRMEGEEWAAATLPPSITALTLDFSQWIGQPGRMFLPSSLQQLGALQQLHLHGGMFCPAVLASLSQLLELELNCCVLLPDAAGVDGATLWLGAVGRMQQLRRLVMEDSSDLTAAQPSSCSALTTSSHLTHLDITPADTRSLPMGAVQHMFPAGKLCPQLQNLTLDILRPDSEDIHFMTGAELAGMISACRGLTSLGLFGALQPGESCSALLQLPPTCRHLGIGGEAFGDSAAATVAQLTQLTKLDWVGSRSLMDAGLFQLTALRSLKELHLDYNHGLSKELVHKEEDGDMCEALIFTELPAQDGRASGIVPVWEQLRDKIRACPSNATWVVLLQQQQQQNQQLQQAVQVLWQQYQLLWQSRDPAAVEAVLT